MGAMENKGMIRTLPTPLSREYDASTVGLNIFNSKFLMADPRTATDDDYMNVERVIAHEVWEEHAIATSNNSLKSDRGSYSIFIIGQGTESPYAIGSNYLSRKVSPSSVKTSSWPTATVVLCSGSTT